MTRHNTPGHSKQRGIAALTAMLVVVLATVLAVELLWSLTLDLRRTETLLTQEQATQVAYGLEALAQQVLEQDYEDAPEADSDNEFWAQDFDFPIDGGTVTGKLQDLQGRFDLNHLIDTSGQKNAKAAEQFRQLVQFASRDLDQELQVNPDNVVDAVMDWMDPDQLPELGGAEDDIYTNKTPPYKTGNFWFTSTSELLAIHEVSPQLYKNLAPWVTALPPLSDAASRHINVNTAPLEVILSLDPEQQNVTRITERLADRPFESEQAFLEKFMGTGSDALPSELGPRLGITSQYFRAHVTVSIGTTQLAMYSLLERAAGDGAVVTRFRSFDTD